MPKVDPKAGSVPTFIPVAAASEDICVIVLKNFVPFTVFAFTPVMVSVCALPSISVPVIVNLTDALLDELEILTVDFKSDAAEIRDIFSKAEGLMGYNVGFDISLIQAEFERSGIPPLDLSNVAIYDAYLIWTKHEGRSLSHAVERFLGKPMEGAHDALADITATVNVFDKMVDEFSLNEYNGKDFTAVFKGNKIDFGGTFRWEDGEIVLGIGKHKGTRAVDVASKNNYLQWIMKSDFPSDAKAIARKATLLYHEPMAFKEWVFHNYGKPSK